MLALSQSFLSKSADAQWNDEILQPSALAANSLEVLRQRLRSLLEDGYPPIDLAAETVNMSRRSLQRQLAEEHLTYSLLVDQVRFEVAVGLLQDPTLKLIEISLELGYEDPANFSRAFKRWAGISPSTFRRIHPST